MDGWAVKWQQKCLHAVVHWACRLASCVSRGSVLQGAPSLPSFPNRRVRGGNTYLCSATPATPATRIHTANSISLFAVYQLWVPRLGMGAGSTTFAELGHSGTSISRCEEKWGARKAGAGAEQNPSKDRSDGLVGHVRNI
eukprot:365942-Chlamydomonas_euryale.AAC.15